jgi:tRNA-modifying protein YgfZ
MNGVAPPPDLCDDAARRFLDDYHALRQAAGVVPIGRDVVRVSGPDAVEYLQGQCSQDVAALALGESVHALLLTPQGKLDALVRVTRTGNDEMYVDTDAGYGPAVVARLARFKLRVRAEIAPVSWRCLAVRGPATVSLSAGRGVALAARYSWGEVEGLDLFGDDPAVDDAVRRCALDAWQSVRVEEGIAVMGAELDDRTIAAEADLLDSCVSFTKGCYTGQELVARLDARGNKVARRLRALVAAAGTPGLSVGAQVVRGERVVGVLTSVAWSPILERAAGLGYVHRDVGPPGAVAIRAGSAGPDVEAEVRALPLRR